MEMLDEKVQLWIDSARFVKPRPGVYIFYDRKLIPIYIGSSDDLQKQFTEYLDGGFDSECMQKTHSYQKIFLDNPEEKKAQLLEDYKKQNGSLPVCNET